MPVRIVPFEPELLPAVVRFAKQIWSRPESEAYFRWRYLECPSLVGYLAMDGPECVAAVWAFLRPYRIGGQSVTCLETHDWFCRPELRGSGLGIGVMRAMMSRPEPIVTIGGSPDTLAILPRLRWQTVGRFDYFALPLEGGELASYVERRLGIPSPLVRAGFRITARPWLMPRHGRPWPGGRVQEIGAVGQEILGLYDGYDCRGIVALPDPVRIRWLIDAVEEMGRFLILEFRVNGHVRGWSFSRLSRGRSGCEASLIDVFTAEQDPGLWAWVVSETLLELVQHRPDVIRAGASSPRLEEALRQNRFLRHQVVPVHLWPSGVGIPVPPHSLANNTADAPFLPYPEG